MNIVHVERIINSNIQITILFCIAPQMIHLKT